MRPPVAHAQELGRHVSGRVRDAETGLPVPGATVVVEGTSVAAQSDSAGRYALARVPAGPQVLLARRVGYAPGRVPVTIGAVDLVVDLAVARSALRLREVRVTADAAGRARGELGTASVVNREAIANQTAASLAGVLELTPGVVLAPPGLDGVQQLSLRAAPATPASGDVSSFGTLIVLDGVPLSNNANLQSGGPRAELGFPTSAGGGIDLRRIPASTLERVEVIRGIPSARFGDLTQGAVVIDTRAGAIAPELLGRYDAQTAELSFAGGRAFGGGGARRQALSVTADVARTRIAPGSRDDAALRGALQLAHRVRFTARDSTSAGAGDDDGQTAAAGLTLDTRLDVYQLYEDRPEQPDIVRGRSNWSRDNGLRAAERATWRPGRAAGRAGARVTATASVERTGQNSYSQRFLLRGAQPFSGRLTPGRDTGFFVGGEYLAHARVTGAPWLLYARLEGERPTSWWGASQVMRAGVELRREWNAGAGYQFDVAAPPQATFTGILGYARPRRYDAIPAVATSALYVDERLQRATPLGAADVQAGLRLDALHRGATWASAAQSGVLEPRLNAQLSPRSWLRLRAGAGRTAKAPSLADLRPAPTFYDVVNVNWFATDPAERLAILTTYVRDATNPSLGFAHSDKAEAGVEIDLGRAGATLAVTAFDDRLRGAPSAGDASAAVLRERFALADSSTGTGRPPAYVEPAAQVDTVPIFLGRPENNLALDTRGVEVTLATPPLPALRTRLELQASVLDSRIRRAGAEFSGSSFSEFQLRPERARVAFYDPTTHVGRRTLLTWRLVHQQPAVGLVVTATVQQTLGERVQALQVPDTLGFAGYVTRQGEVVYVPRAERGGPQYADLRGTRPDFFTTPFTTPDGWIMNLQVSKTLPLEGRLSFYAYNALALTGRYGTANAANRLYAPVRFGTELSMPLGGLVPKRARAAGT